MEQLEQIRERIFQLLDEARQELADSGHSTPGVTLSLDVLARWMTRPENCGELAGPKRKRRPKK